MNDKNTKKYICYERKDYFTIGEHDADICIVDFPVQILFEKNRLTVNTDLDSNASDIFINGNNLAEPCWKLEHGDEVKSGDYKFIFLPQRLLLECKDEHKIISSLLEVQPDSTFFEGFPIYKRSPRIIKRVQEKTITIDKPKDKQEKKKGGLVQLIVPPLMMMCMTVAISFLLKRGMFVLMSVGGTLMTTIFSVTKYFTEKKEQKEMNELRKTTYQSYLLRKRKIIHKAYSDETEAYNYNYPDVKRIEAMIRGYSERIYERSAIDEDFLAVSVGKAYRSCKFKIKMSMDELNTKPDELEQEGRSIVNEFSNITQPVVVDLKKSHLGLVGDKETIHEQLKLLIAQLTFFHSYHDMEIVAIYSEKYDDHFQWMRWYPHLRIHAINAIGTINSERKRDQILGSLHQILKDRKLKIEESKKQSMFLPHFVFIIDEPKLIMDHSIMEYLDREGYNLGFSIIYTTNFRANLPENIGTIVMLENSCQATLLMEDKEEKNLPFKLRSTASIELEWMARNLSVLEHMQGISAQIPDSITFFQMYHVEHPQQLDISKRWRKNNSAKSLAVPLGVRAEDDLVNLNLHEKAHGPHGLVAGTTGSGKSEIIQSFILSLAVNFHPYEVAFLLIDYKGGGMAGLFKNLPHLLGTITNLDGSQSMRAMASIKSELARRQRIFGSYDVNHINSYNKLFKNGEASEPLPHLFIISDEFAELKKEQPEFMTELVSAARIGRSLGVHLILATQKPTGVVDDQIWTNSKFKLALMVQNESDSKEILKTPDAANITKPGRAYLQVGNNEIYELFQSAWSGAAYCENQEEEKTDDRVYLVNDLGQGELINPDLSDEKESRQLAVTQLDATVDHIHDVYDQQDTVAVKRPWLPPLGEQITCPEELQDANGKPLDMKLRIGLVDIPEKQAQVEYRINLEKDGNLLYIASPGYGKTVFLTTAILSLALHNSVKALNFYILDFGNSGLIPLNKLHHTADYITFDDMERFNKLQGIIQQEMQDRKKLLAARMVQNFEVYNQVADDPMKAIVIILDNFDVVKELDFDAEDFFMKVSRDGAGLGIYMIATATRSIAIKYSTLNNFKNKVAGYLFDESDVNTIVGRSSYKQSEIKGRTLVKWNNGVNVMQIFTMTRFHNELEYNKGIDQVIQDINGFYPDQKAPRIPVLPETLEYAPMLEYEKKGDAIWIGLDKQSVKLCGFHRSMTPFVVLGEGARGKTNAMKVVLEQIIGTGDIYLFDSKGMELFGYKGRERVHYMDDTQPLDEFIELMKQEIKTRNEAVRTELIANPEKNPKDICFTLPPLYMVVDDWDDFVEHTKQKAAAVPPLLLSAAGAGISIIVTGHSGKMKGFDEVTKFAKGATDGILLGSPGTSGLFNLSSTKELPQFGDGLLFHNGNYIRIKLPKFSNLSKSEVTKE